MIRRWLRRVSDLDNKEFNPDLPWGTCRASWRVHGPIPYVTCGKRTNLKHGEHWACSVHQSPTKEPV